MASFGDDVQAVQDAVQSQTSQSRDVILVLHSYGGMVGQSAMKGFTRTGEASRPTTTTAETGHIIGLVNIATGYAQPNMTFLDGTGGTPPPTWRLKPGAFAELQVPARPLFYNDLPEAEGDEWVAKLTKQSSKAFTEGRGVAYPGWKDVPV